MNLTKEQIRFLDRVCFGRKNWKLNSNGEVDVEGRVDMSKMNLTKIPVKFGKVEGWFNCSFNNLTTLKNCPHTLEENIDFSNNQITTLEYFPKIINGELHCSMDNNPLHNYFKNIKEEDFDNWRDIDWFYCFDEYPYLINILKRYIYGKDYIRYILDKHPLLKIYLK